MRSPGDPIDQGLSAKAASELGLLKGTAVGTSLIDAHAGGIGMIGCSVPGVPYNLQSRLGICKSSNFVSLLCIIGKFFKPIYGIYSIDLWHINVPYDS